jgi:protein-tyrosine phosphatase
MDLATRYGRRAGLLRHGFARSLELLGVYEDVRAVRWAEVRRLVFVCQGNLCRSAYAAAKAQALGLAAASFGLAARERICADPRAVARAAARGIDLRDHRTTSAAAFVVASGDLLLAMEPRQLRSLGALGQDGWSGRAPAQLPQRTLLGLWSSPPRPHLEDPYGLSSAYFDTCFAAIDSALQAIAPLARGAR